VDRPGPHLPASPATTLWGRLPCELDPPVLEVSPGQQLSIYTVSHEGILEDQGRDPVAFFAGRGVPAAAVLADAVEIAAASPHTTDDGPDVITGPIAVRGAKPGDYLTLRMDELIPRASYGIISSHHGRGLLPAAYPEAAAPVISVFCSVTGLDHGIAAARARLPLTLEPGSPWSSRSPPSSASPGLPRPAPCDCILSPRDCTAATWISRCSSGAAPSTCQSRCTAAISTSVTRTSPRETARSPSPPSKRHCAPCSPSASSAPTGHPPCSAPATVLSCRPRVTSPTGLDHDLDTAVARCAANAIELLHARYGMQRHLAYAHLSAVADFDGIGTGR
jgi:hypothetical protein